jgi:hypothetical protein
LSLPCPITYPPRNTVNNGDRKYLQVARVQLGDIFYLAHATYAPQWSMSKLQTSTQRTSLQLCYGGVELTCPLNNIYNYRDTPFFHFFVLTLVDFASHNPNGLRLQLSILCFTDSAQSPGHASNSSASTSLYPGLQHRVLDSLHLQMQSRRP